MPVQRGSNPIKEALAKQGLQKAFDEHKGDETDYGGGGDLPAGINGGVAQLTTAKLDLYKTGDNKGKPYLMLVGIVKSPAEVVGMRATKMIALCDDPKTWGTPKTSAEHVAEALNEMRKLGIGTEGLKLDDWEDALTALAQAAPHFRFHTWAGINQATKKPGRTKTDFDGLVKDYVDDGSGANAVVDNTGGGSASGGETQAEPDSTDWATLAEQAEAGDADCMKQIVDACLTAGVPQADIDKAPNWVATVDLLTAAGGSGAGAVVGASTGAGEAFKPEVGQFYAIRPRGAKKDVEIEVTAVFAATLNGKRADNEAVEKSIPWTADPPTVGGKPV